MASNDVIAPTPAICPIVLAAESAACRRLMALGPLTRSGSVEIEAAGEFRYDAVWNVL